MNQQPAKRSGDRVPDATFQIRQNGEWKQWTTDDIFKGRTVVVFALPGAFTPTCSSTHLPGYMAAAGDLKANGVDAVYCLSVNDSFVMNAWAKDQYVADEVLMLPDGCGHFSRGMGMLVDKDYLGFGWRSWRYAMLVRDGVVERMFVEDRNDSGDPFQVSDAVTMLKYVKERAAKAA